MRIFSDLYGTLQSFFRFGSVAVKDNSGVVAARNKGDTAYVPVAGSQINLMGSTSGTSGFIAPAVASQQWTLPGTDGSNQQVLATTGTGTLEFISIPTNALGTEERTIAFGSGTTTTVFTPPANALIENVLVIVDTVFNATGPATIQVGVTGTLGQYMATTANDLTFAAEYDNDCMVAAGASPSPVIITFSPGTGGTAGSARVLISYSVPS